MSPTDSQSILQENPCAKQWVACRKATSRRQSHRIRISLLSRIKQLITVDSSVKCFHSLGQKKDRTMDAVLAVLFSFWMSSSLITANPQPHDSGMQTPLLTSRKGISLELQARYHTFYHQTILPVLQEMAQWMLQADALLKEMAEKVSLKHPENLDPSSPRMITFMHCFHYWLGACFDLSRDPDLQKKDMQRFYENNRLPLQKVEVDHGMVSYLENQTFDSLKYRYLQCSLRLLAFKDHLQHILKCFLEKTPNRISKALFFEIAHQIDTAISMEVKKQNHSRDLPYFFVNPWPRNNRMKIMRDA